MVELRVTEVLPEGEHHAWITLSDNRTRLVGLHSLQTLPTHRALRLRRLVRCPQVTPEGQHVVWPGGALLDVTSVQQAPHGPLPLTLIAMMPAALRYRPLIALLRHSEPRDHLDVRSETTLRSRLGLKESDLATVLEWHRPVPPDLVLARLSDLLLALRMVVPGEMLPALLRQPWPYAQRHHPDRSLLDTALGCLRFGRIDLVEAPLVHLLLPAWPGEAVPRLS